MIGHKNSDQPIILPMDPDDLARHRRRHPKYTYWCGIQLDGCGRELADRLCRDGRVCHFAHHPDPDGTRPVCQRSANGEDSADHLFIKQGVTRWLGKQQLRGKTTIRDLGQGPGGAVDIHLPDRRHRLRFQMNGLDIPTWRRVDEELGEDADTVDWIFNHDGPVTREMLGRYGYSLRVRLETHGAERRVHIGAEHPDRAIDWTPLEECTISPGGLLTPAVESIRISAARPRPKPAGFLLQGSVAFTPDTASLVPDASPFAAAGRHLLMADVKPTDSRTVRALLSLPADAPVPAGNHVYRCTGAVRMLVTDPSRSSGAEWAIEANAFVRLNAHEAQRTGLWTPPPADQVAASDTPSPAPLPVAEPAQPPKQRQQPSPARPAPEPTTKRDRTDIVVAVRDALIRDAQLRARPTWETLARVADLGLDRLNDSDRRDLLIDVDRPLADDKPILSALVHSEGGGPLPYLASVLYALGLGRPESDAALKRWCAREIDRAHAAHGVPSRALPPRLPLQAPGEAWAPQRTAAVKNHQPTSSERLRTLIAHGERLLPDAQGKRSRLKSAIKDAQKWLRLRNSLRVTRQERLNGGASPSANHVEEALYRAIQAVERSQEQKRQTYIRESEAPAAPTRATKAGPPSPQQQRPTGVPVAPSELRRLLTETAVRGETATWEQLIGGERALTHDHPESIRWESLVNAEGQVTGDVPLLSSLVTDTGGGPVPYFRQILLALGFEVPETKQRLEEAWCREQVRCHAAHSTPRQAMPPSLLSKAWTKSTSLSKPQSATGTSPETERLTSEQIGELGARIKGFLAQTAMAGATITWSTIRHRLGDSLPWLPPEDQGELLVRADEATPADEPLLSALIVVGDHVMHPLYRHVAFSLEREVPESDEELQQRWAMDVLKLHALWRHR
ncbi:hypothetical protein [Streptomyces luteireticuli]|uniref:hypothetical protein n=1 Tax=Streptomyces luteireticuli TaxID=173858 RepID=UPI0031DB25E7